MGYGMAGGMELRFSGSEFRSLENYQYRTEGQKFHGNLAPALVIVYGNSLVFPRKNYYRTAPPMRQHQ